VCVQEGTKNMNSELNSELDAVYQVGYLLDHGEDRVHIGTNSSPIITDITQINANILEASRSSKTVCRLDVDESDNQDQVCEQQPNSHKSEKEGCDVEVIERIKTLEDHVAKIKSRFTQNDGIATVKDVRIDDPTVFEAKTLLKNKSNLKWLQFSSFFLKMKPDEKETLCEPLHNIWEVIIDLFRSIIIYGYGIKKELLRGRMLKVWMTWCIECFDIDSIKNVGGKDFKISAWIKLVKFKLAAFASFAKSSDVLPKSPLKTLKSNASMILDKEFRSWFLSLKGDQDLVSRIYYMSLTDTLARGAKKGAARSTESDCIVSCIETFELFTTSKEKPTYKVESTIGGFIDGNGIDMGVTDMLYEVERTVKELIVFDADFVMLYTNCPSFSSSVRTSTLNGGQVHDVKEYLPKFQREPIITKKFGMFTDPFPMDGYNDTGESNPVCASPLESIDIDSEEMTKHIGEMYSSAYIEWTINPDNVGTDLDIEELYEKCLSYDSIIKPIGLKEALKVRGITTCDGLETWLLKPLQKYLSKTLLKFKCFAVTGGPLSDLDLKRVIKQLHHDEFMISGDYDNATNMMIGEYTRKCITTICEQLELPEYVKKVAVRSLCDNKVRYGYRDRYGSGKLDYEEFRFEGDQKEAQPMGKILSFVVLCIVNLTVCRKAIELDRKCEILCKNFPGLINGDDCCFPLRRIEHWVGTSAMVGLFNSIGKTFKSKEFVEMNSRTFLITSNELTENYRKDLKFTEVPFVNFGLMKGMVRSASTEEKPGIKSNPEAERKRDVIEATSRMGWCHKELTKGFSFFYDDLDYLFKSYHNKYLLSKELAGIPFYIPFWLGGLGLDPGPDFEKKITLDQLKCAREIYQNMNKKNKRPQSVCLSKTCLIDDIISKYTNKYAKELDLTLEIPDFQTLISQDEDVNYNLLMENQKVYSSLVEYVWRDKPLSEFFTIIDDNFISVSARLSIRKLMKNQKLWLNAYNKSKHVDMKPLEWYKLWHQKQNKVLPLVLEDPVRSYKKHVQRLNDNQTPI